MDDPIITKRLHISGLTPSLTTADISKRLSSFGTVKALDGFGLLDGVGQPRKFGYVTMETTEASLAKCLNVLSGSTWKGAKLRIGEARPDYAERLARERENTDLEPQKQNHRHAYEEEAPDMPLVTPESVEREGPNITPMETEPSEESEIAEPSIVTPENVSEREGPNIAPMETIAEPSEESEIAEPSIVKQQRVKLKDLFAPREEEAGFSLVQHLDPDLELDDEVIIPPSAKAQSPSSTYQDPRPTSTDIPPFQAPSRTVSFEIDPKQPLFFPFASAGAKGRTKDPFDVARDGGWHWRDPAVGFYRTDTDDDIRAKWEKEKVELTRDWKRRSREAGKLRKRRGGDADYYGVDADD